MTNPIRFLDYLLTIADGSVDANWQGASQGFVGDVLVNGTVAKERTSGTVPFKGTLYTNETEAQFAASPWSRIVNANPGQATVALNEQTRVSGAVTDLRTPLVGVNNLTATPGYTNVNAASLDELNTKNGIGQTFVINVTSGFQISSKIDITGDANDVFIFRWDSDLNKPGYQGQVKFQSGGAIVPHGDLTAGSFLHVAGDLNASGGGTTPVSRPGDTWQYPQGPFAGDKLIDGGKLFNGGGFFTGHWLTTGKPEKTLTLDTGETLLYGKTSPFSNAIFVGGWHTISDQFSLTSGSSDVYVAPTDAMTTFLSGDQGPFAF